MVRAISRLKRFHLGEVTVVVRRSRESMLQVFPRRTYGMSDSWPAIEGVSHVVRSFCTANLTGSPIRWDRASRAPHALLEPSGGVTDRAPHSPEIHAARLQASLTPEIR